MSKIYDDLECFSSVLSCMKAFVVSVVGALGSISGLIMMGWGGKTIQIGGFIFLQASLVIFAIGTLALYGMVDHKESTWKSHLLAALLIGGAIGFIGGSLVGLPFSVFDPYFKPCYESMAVGLLMGTFLWFRRINRST